MIQDLVCHPGHESGCSVGFPLNVTHAPVSLSKSDFESEFEATNPGT